MIQVTDKNIAGLQPVSPAERQAWAAWFRTMTTAQLLRLKLERGGRFCVVQGDYSRRKTSDIAESLKDLADIGAHRSPAARFLARELVQRRSGWYAGANPTDPNGPQAA